MDRENTPQKQRQKRSGSNRRNSSTSGGVSSHGPSQPSRASMSSVGGPPRSFRGPQRPRSRTAASAAPTPAAIMSKPPSMLLRGAPPASGVLYEPDAPDAARRARHSVAGPTDREQYLLQVNTRGGSGRTPSPSPLDRRNLRTSPSAAKQGVMRPHTPSTMQQTKIVPPSTSVKLITPQMQFATDLSVKLGSCLELTNFTVVGVLGLEGVGKSTVLSLLADKEPGQEKEEGGIFATRSLEALVMDRHETTGVDLAVSMVGGSGHPTILLDSQPLLSSSMLADALERNEAQRFGAITPEQQVEVASYQIAVFLFAICHYVVVVHDGFAFQVSVNHLLRKIEQKFAQCRLPSVSGNSQKHAAQLLFVANNIADSEILYRENELLSAHERALEVAWAQALVRVPYKTSIYTDPADEDTGTSNVASFILPHRQQQAQHRGSKDGTRPSSASTGSENKTAVSRSKTNTTISPGKYAEFSEAADDFQRFVLSLPSSPSFTSQTLPLMTPGSRPLPPPHPLSLREWLSNASRVFEGVRKASCFTAEYTLSRDHH